MTRVEHVEEAGLWIAGVRLVVVLFAAIGVGLKRVGTAREGVGVGGSAGRQARVRADMEPTGYPEERDLLGLGLRSRVLAPLQVGPRAIGMLGLVRAEANAVARRGSRRVARRPVAA